MNRPADAIKIHGLQRTGTNAAQAILTGNYRHVRPLTTSLGGKHQPVSYDALNEPGLRFIITIKDPCSWVVSYWRYRAAQAREETPPRVYDPLPHQVPDWLDYWDQRTTSWLDLAQAREDACIVVQHEHLLTHPQHFLLDQIDTKWGLDRVPGPPRLYRHHATRRGSQDDHGDKLLSPHLLDRNYHLTGKWRHDAGETTMRLTLDFFRTWLDKHPAHATRFDTTHLPEL